MARTDLSNLSELIKETSPKNGPDIYGTLILVEGFLEKERGYYEDRENVGNHLAKIDRAAEKFAGFLAAHAKIDPEIPAGPLYNSWKLLLESRAYGIPEEENLIREIVTEKTIDGEAYDLDGDNYLEKARAIKSCRKKHEGNSQDVMSWQIAQTLYAREIARVNVD